MKWFRMHTSLVDSIKVGTLGDSAFRTYVELLCLAGEKDDSGRTGVEEKTINWRLRRDVTVTLHELFHAGLVTSQPDGEFVIEGWNERQFKADNSAERTRAWRASKKSGAPKSLKDKGASVGVTTPNVTVTSPSQKCDSLEQNRTEQSRTEERTPLLVPDGTPAEPSSVKDKVDVPDCPHDEIVAAYHELLPANPVVVEWTDARKAMLRQRWRERFTSGSGKRPTNKAEGLEWFRRYFGYVGQSAFLTGQVGRTDKPPFLADLEWLVRPQNFVKVIEGKYHG